MTDLTKLSKLKLLDLKDRKNADFWKISEEFNNVWNERRLINNRFQGVARKKADCEREMLEIIEAYNRRNGK